MSKFLGGGGEQDAPPAKSGGFFGLGGLVANLIENVTSMNVNDEDSDESYGDFEAGELDEEEIDDFEEEVAELDLDKKYDVGKSVINRGADSAAAKADDTAEGAEETGYMGARSADIFQTRVGPNYNKTKKKASSAPAMLEMMSIDFFRTPVRVSDIGKKLNIPPEWSEGIDTGNPDIPPIFIVNAQIPHNWKTTLFTDKSDGPCFNLVIVYRLTKETAAAMANLDTAPPAVKLFAEYLMFGPSACEPVSPIAGPVSPEEPAVDDSAKKGKMGALMGKISASAKSVSTLSPFSDKKKEAGSRDWVGRTKLIVQCENIGGLKLPKFLMHYNGKPVLLRESGNLVRGDNYVELDINVKKFGQLACKMLPLVLSRLCFMVVSMGFIVESREEAEMPEGVFGSLLSHKATGDPRKVPMWFTKTD